MKPESANGQSPAIHLVLGGVAALRSGTGRDTDRIIAVLRVHEPRIRQGGNMNRVITVLLGVFLLCVFMPAKSNGNHADIRGRITKVQRAAAEDERRIIGTVMVESDERNAKIDKANLIVTDKTRIFKKQDDKRVESRFEDLEPGQQVEAVFVEGPTIMIYPLQVAAAEIVILNN
jgi:hypothetical protein